MLIIIGAICHLRYIASGIGISLCQQGSPLGPILFLLIFNIPHIIRYFLTMIGYKSGAWSRALVAGRSYKSSARVRRSSASWSSAV